MVDRNGSDVRTREKHEAKVHVVTSRYALALQRRNQKLRSKSVDASKKSLDCVGQINCAPDDFDASRSPSRTATNRNSPAVQLHGRRKAEYSHIEQRKQLRSTDLPSRRVAAKTIYTSGLHTKLRPAFPTRISTPTGKKINRSDSFVEEYCRDGIAVFAHSRSTSESSGESAITKQNGKTESEAEMINAKSTEAHVSAELSEIDEVGLLENVYYQLCFAETKVEDTFRRQEQRTEDQMLAAWEILESKMQHLQEASLRLDRLRHTMLLAEPSAQLIDELPPVLDSISQLCSSLEVALNRISCSGLTCTNPLQLEQHVEALTLEFDKLLEHIEASHISDAVSSAMSFEQDMQRLSAKSSTALLQAAHLFTKLAVGVNQGKVTHN